MTLNQDMISHGRVAWGTQLQIEGLSDWTNEQIVHLAGVAHQKMIKAHKANTWDRTQVKGKTTDGPPTVTTTLVFDNTAFIASSVKSPESFMYVTDGKNRFMELHADAPCNGAILTALNNCRTAQGFGHLTGAKCGEIWAAQGFCNTRTNRSLKGARIVAINMDKTDKQNPKPQVVDPCGSWGPDLPVVGRSTGGARVEVKQLLTKTRNTQERGAVSSSRRSWSWT